MDPGPLIHRLTDALAKPRLEDGAEVRALLNDALIALRLLTAPRAVQRGNAAVTMRSGQRVSGSLGADDPL